MSQVQANCPKGQTRMGSLSQGFKKAYKVARIQRRCSRPPAWIASALGETGGPVQPTTPDKHSAANQEKKALNTK
jgi:hypothetical protein